MNLSSLVESEYFHFLSLRRRKETKDDPVASGAITTTTLMPVVCGNVK